jgi:hypothetical protein
VKKIKGKTVDAQSAIMCCYTDDEVLLVPGFMQVG